ncbi:CAF17-like 4Fe-4S cluster assembly/insertion protein YgfZ [Spiribacter pallidus]|uniref:Folate-binding protein n=1 Tax=Spiribacter pallidus TaxID=1987936 RepID=A0ABV3T9H6_9GAMM
MREPWRQLLDPQSVNEPAPTPAALELACTDSGVVCPLPGTGVLHVAGEDAGTFLQNQLTQSITDMATTETRLAAWCNPKGRTRAVFRVIPSDTGWVLMADAELIRAIQPTLQMFVLRARVALTDLSDEEGLLGLAGPSAETLLTETAGSLPRAVNTMVRAGDLHIVALPAPTGLRYAVLGPLTQIGALWSRYREALTAGNEAFWQLLDIRSGLPAIDTHTRETFIPTMLNLDALGGIRYDKGCYPGQEVVARLHYRGQLKRQMYRLALEDAAPDPGAAVVDSDGSEAGTVVAAAPAAEDRVECLAVLRIDRANAGQLTVDGQPATPQPLPYPLPAEADRPAGG